MEPIEGSETPAFKPQTPGKYLKENILHKEHGESLKSRHLCFFSSKCSLFHNSNVFGSCIIHILYTGRAKIKKK